MKLMHVNLMHFCTVTTKDQKEKLKKQFHLPLQEKIIKYLGANLCKGTKDLYSENYFFSVREIKDNTNRWRDTPCS